jgi:hypothetical protein
MTDNTNEDTNPFEWTNVPKAKRHRLLRDVSARLRGCHQTGTFDVFGTRYVLRTLAPNEESWTVQYVQGNDFFSAAKTKRAPTVAAAIVAVGELDESGACDVLPVEQLFEMPDDMPKGTRQLIEANDAFRKDWLRGEVLRWLVEPENHEAVIATLYDHYLGLEEKRNEALGALRPLSKRTPIGGSSATSSPEKESSSATPASPG